MGNEWYKKCTTLVSKTHHQKKSHFDFRQPPPPKKKKEKNAVFFGGVYRVYMSVKGPLSHRMSEHPVYSHNEVLSLPCSV